MSEERTSYDRTNEIQQRIYEFIVNYMREEGMPPTNREVGAAMNIPSIGHVDYHLTMLEKKGLIERESKKSRGIRLKQPLNGIPVLGSITTDEPIEVFSAPLEVLQVGREFEQEGAYALIVKGHSMIEDHIRDNDYVIIKPTTKGPHGNNIINTLEV